MPIGDLAKRRIAAREDAKHAYVIDKTSFKLPEHANAFLVFLCDFAALRAKLSNRGWLALF